MYEALHFRKTETCHDLHAVESRGELMACWASSAFNPVTPAVFNLCRSLSILGMISCRVKTLNSLLFCTALWYSNSTILILFISSKIKLALTFHVVKLFFQANYLWSDNHCITHYLTVLATELPSIARGKFTWSVISPAVYWSHISQGLEISLRWGFKRPLIFRNAFQLHAGLTEPSVYK